jgi:hypothetical protein
LAPYIPLQKWVIKRAETIVGTTPSYVRDSPWLKDVKHKVTYVPIGIEPVIPDKEKVRDIQEQYGQRKIVFSLGRLVPYKGYTYLISAAKFLPDDYVVIIGGAGPLREELETQIQDSGLNQKVKLLGRVEDEDLPSLYGASSVFVLSSVLKAEAFGIVQIEAMSAGIPVIATKIPESGTAWVNEDGYSGINVEPSDPEELAKAFLGYYNRGLVNGLFLSSGISSDAESTMEKQIETVHLLRNKYGYDDYIHLKVVPGASKDSIKRAMALSNRVSINIEAATPSGLAELSSTKDYNKDILKRLSLKNTGINSIGISHLMKAIEKLKNIQEIHLENNDLDENVCNELCQLCKDKNYKIYISISNLKFDNVNDKFKGINNIVIE